MHLRRTQHSRKTMVLQVTGAVYGLVSIPTDAVGMDLRIFPLFFF